MAIQKFVTRKKETLTLKLRPYQKMAVEAIVKCWQTCRSCLIAIPSECGRTVFFGESVRRRKFRARRFQKF